VEKIGISKHDVNPAKQSLFHVDKVDLYLLFPAVAWPPTNSSTFQP
jgi:hypothetical protein